MAVVDWRIINIKINNLMSREEGIIAVLIGNDLIYSRINLCFFWGKIVEFIVSTKNVVF